MPPAATKERSGQRADARRNRGRVLEAAREQFAARGLEAQIDDIARAAGVGVGTVYRHFPNKEDLLRALAEAKFEGLAQAARDALGAEDPWTGLVEMMTHGARVSADDLSLSEAMEQHPGICGEAAEHAGLPELTERVVKRAQESGQLRSDIVAWDIPALVCGIGRAIRVEPGAPTMHWERYLDIILAGLRAR